MSPRHRSAHTVAGKTLSAVQAAIPHPHPHFASLDFQGAVDGGRDEIPDTATGVLGVHWPSWNTHWAAGKGEEEGCRWGRG